MYLSYLFSISSIYVVIVIAMIIAIVYIIAEQMLNLRKYICDYLYFFR